MSFRTAPSRRLRLVLESTPRPGVELVSEMAAPDGSDTLMHRALAAQSECEWKHGQFGTFTEASTTTPID
jgi:hypothetical protein